VLVLLLSKPLLVLLLLLLLWVVKSSGPRVFGMSMEACVEDRGGGLRGCRARDVVVALDEGSSEPDEAQSSRVEEEGREGGAGAAQEEDEARRLPPAVAVGAREGERRREEVEGERPWPEGTPPSLIHLRKGAEL
jgi:hypothetical protein